MYGPNDPISAEQHATKYRQPGETFPECANRVSATLGDGDDHRRAFRSQLLKMEALPGGRIQRAIGAPLQVTAYNCTVSRTIPDDSAGIMDTLKEAFLTMRMGAGIGYDFSTLRPRGANITTLQSGASGPVSFMQMFDAMCKTVRSAGGRRGAQMAVLRIDHPDIEEFVTAKTTAGELSAFNISVGVTDAFMAAVRVGGAFPLTYGGQVYRHVDARALWDKIMRATWDWAEPGVLFIDRINQLNNLYYCETIAATNPCGEQPLPPYGACLLGSFNLTKFTHAVQGGHTFDLDRFAQAVPTFIRAMDNVVDRTIYPLPEQEAEAKNKRRMGIGITGTANAIEACGRHYATDGYIDMQTRILRTLRVEAYRASALLAAEKGAFPLFDRDAYLAAPYIMGLPADVRDLIAKHGIRNSHLTSIAPTGTISLCADNVSSGIEPVLYHRQTRTIIADDGTARAHDLVDYGVRRFGVKGRTADEITAAEHVQVFAAAQGEVDSAVSKTCTVGDGVSFPEFRELYVQAYDQGAKGCTTFRPGGLRFGVINPSPEPDDSDGLACMVDPETGVRSCED